MLYRRLIGRLARSNSSLSNVPSGAALISDLARPRSPIDLTWIADCSTGSWAHHRRRAANNPLMLGSRKSASWKPNPNIPVFGEWPESARLARCRASRSAVHNTFNFPTPPDLPIHPADLPRRSDCRVATAKLGWCSIDESKIVSASSN
jgi:hypothetical protein